MKQNHIAVSCTTTDRLSEAQALASQLGLCFFIDPSSQDAKTYDYLLLFTPDYIGLQDNRDKKLAPFYIDFLSNKLRYRSQQAGLKNELLARSMGAKPSTSPTIVDTTAGLGRDSFILASLGFTITLIERSPILHTLLADGLRRAKEDAEIAPIVARLCLLQDDSVHWLKMLPKNQHPQIIYLDPMFPERKKSASVKKEMATLQHLLPKDNNDQELLETALACASKRVVVKRPRLADTLSARTPNFSLTGKSSRFDIYLV